MAKASKHSDPQALLNKARQLQQIGQLQQAAGHYRKYLRLQPDDAEIWHTLAGLYFQGNKLEQAYEALNKAVQKGPDNADYINDLGGLYLADQNLEKAEECYRGVLALNSAHHGARYNLSQVLYEQGRIAESIGLLQQLVREKPDYLEAHYNLGIALHYQGQYQAAIEALERVLVLQPGFTSAHLQLATYCQELHYLQKAIKHYEQALTNHPGESTAVLGIADCLHEEGQTQKAIDILKQEIATGSENPEYYAALGRLLHDFGNLSEAEANYLYSLEIEPANSKAIFGLSNVRKFTNKDEVLIEKIEKLLSRVKTEQADALHFALGKIYNDCKHYKSAFDHYRKANRIKQYSVTYKSQNYSRRLERMKSCCSAELIGSLREMGSDSNLPVIIVGMPRSGTTLTEQIIAAHPKSHGAGELVYFSSIARGLPQLIKTDNPYPECLPRLTAEIVTQLADGYLGLLRRHSDTAIRVTDKMPGNFWHLGLIASLFPNAKLIHCTRDPLDVCLSIYFQSFAAIHAHDYAWDLRNIAHYYNLYRQMMEHWHQVLPGEILDVNYDSLIAEPETHARLLVEYCGLEWDPACLEFYKSEREVRTASNWQVRQPIYKTSSRRWENYQEHLGEVMEILGYEASSNCASA